MLVSDIEEKEVRQRYREKVAKAINNVVGTDEPEEAANGDPVSVKVLR